jgi:hypothetical protein
VLSEHFFATVDAKTVLAIEIYRDIISDWTITRLDLIIEADAAGLARYIVPDRRLSLKLTFRAFQLLRHFLHTFSDVDKRALPVIYIVPRFTAPCFEQLLFI